MFNQTIKFLQRLSNNDEINSQCKNSLRRWLDGIKDSELWALKLLEATGLSINGKLFIFLKKVFYPLNFIF
jgi:hypothetical protein